MSSPTFTSNFITDSETIKDFYWAIFQNSKDRSYFLIKEFYWKVSAYTWVMLWWDRVDGLFDVHLFISSGGYMILTLTKCVCSLYKNQAEIIKHETLCAELRGATFQQQ